MAGGGSHHGGPARLWLGANVQTGRARASVAEPRQGRLEIICCCGRAPAAGLLGIRHKYESKTPPGLRWRTLFGEDRVCVTPAN